MLLGDAVFPFLTWLMKPYTNAVLSKEQGYFSFDKAGHKWYLRLILVS